MEEQHGTWKIHVRVAGILCSNMYRYMYMIVVHARDQRSTCSSVHVCATRYEQEHFNTGKPSETDHKKDRLLRLE